VKGAVSKVLISCFMGVIPDVAKRSSGISIFCQRRFLSAGWRTGMTAVADY